MTVRSMTGFARADGLAGPLSWHWEVRSVNGRGLDVRARLPPGYEGLEAQVREAVARRLSRGSINITLHVRREDGAGEIRLNEAALAQAVRAADRAVAIAGGERPPLAALLALKGVLEVVEPAADEEAERVRIAAILASLDAALDRLTETRAEEGGRLAAVLTAQVDQIERLCGAIAAAPARRPEVVRQRLAEQVARVLDAARGSLDESRLHQEAALLATRGDIEEELKRLAAHVAAARALLAAGEPVGRKLDFLTQEFNREANTLCAKAQDAEITTAGLALKAVIDQMREQVQNIE
jgi:uncharacterized protein (TIGR00255 family)